METIRIARVMQDAVLKARGRSIGFVPTMGALHEGHLSLVRTARAENDLVVVSIFVNPLQFGPSEDLQRYPRDLEGDMEKLQALEVDYLFLPEPEGMYPQGFCTFVEVQGLSERLCGAFRPGHFRGVATVVLKLFEIVQPTRAYFGQKDYQQSLIVRRMVEDLNLPLQVVVCPTVREPDGLAMSSRNLYLSPQERRAAPILYKALLKGQEALLRGQRQPHRIRELMHQVLRSEPLVGEVQYASAYDPYTLEEPPVLRGSALLAVAAFIGRTRLIDNLLIDGLK
jgi:pantoate--beta-alanine ligase